MADELDTQKLLLSILSGKRGDSAPTQPQFFTSAGGPQQPQSPLPAPPPVNLSAFSGIANQLPKVGDALGTAGKDIMGLFKGTPEPSGVAGVTAAQKEGGAGAGGAISKLFGGGGGSGADTGAGGIISKILALIL